MKLDRRIRRCRFYQSDPGVAATVSDLSTLRILYLHFSENEEAARINDTCARLHVPWLRSGRTKVIHRKSHGLESHARRHSGHRDACSCQLEQWWGGKRRTKSLEPLTCRHRVRSRSGPDMTWPNTKE